ncbi:bifunctional diaminohydroxyphosphoribosylaminopyrimidine deaminase/5-amino-6-(5-phosphoribosylamino)uracil reductase RibD [Pseudotenacibaculum haliotis]|uniref:Riboflavin biosynthesis protein RibD n=1 Tax=Pseudotenacibaculum haliotis TaxID=1862138 RepID=A0ABW5LN58_9FLAO
MSHEQYIKRCLEIAQKGIGSSRPNPSVGAVLVANDQIIGEGFTSPYGGSHAEVNAISSVKDEELLAKATLYVTLEPCSHFGKTPPCSDLIIRKGIPKVVIGCLDTNSLVAGKGIEKLKKAGCEVHVGVLEEECKEHHKRFFTFHNKKRPYIILKWAESQDGFIAPDKRETREPVWITNERSRQLVHKWRAEEHGILVGTTTVIADNPKLNVRNWEGQNPVRIVVDRSLKIDQDSHVYDQTVRTIFITAEEKESQGHLVFEKVDFSKPLASQICGALHRQNIQSLIVEGGTQTLQTFIEEDLWDEARVFSGEIKFLNGVEAPQLNKEAKEITTIDQDILKVYKND